MDEFRKPYEYDEENGVAGLLLIFFIMLVTFEVLLGIVSATTLYRYLKANEILRTMAAVIGITYIVITIFTGIALFKIKRIAKQVSRSYLMVRLIYLVPFIIFNFIKLLNNPERTDKKVFSSVMDIIIYSLILPLVYVLLFSILWNIYFKKSKRVQSLYGITGGSETHA